MPTSGVSPVGVAGGSRRGYVAVLVVHITGVLRNRLDYLLQSHKYITMFCYRSTCKHWTRNRTKRLIPSFRCPFKVP